MKKIFVFAVVLLILVSCSPDERESSLSLTLMGDSEISLCKDEETTVCVYFRPENTETGNVNFEVISSDPLIAVGGLDGIVIDAYAYFKIAALEQGEADIRICANNSDECLILHVTVSEKSASDDTQSDPNGYESSSEFSSDSSSDSGEDSSESPPAENTITVVSFTSSVKRGSSAELQIRGIAGRVYSVKVKTKSGYSSSSGLVDKTADDDGFVIWEWRVGGSSATDFKPIVTVTDKESGETLTLTYTVEK